MPTRLLLGLLGSVGLPSVPAAGDPLSSPTAWPGALSSLTILPVVVVAGALVDRLLGAARRLVARAGELGAPGAAGPGQTVEELYRRGRDAQLAGRAVFAVAAFEEIVRREPAHAGAHARLAELAAGRGDHQEALAHSLQAMRADEGPATMLAAAAAYARAGRDDDALTLYRDVLARDPGHLVALRQLRDAAAARGRWADALPAQERLARLAPPGERAAERDQLAGIHYELGAARLARGDAPGALAALREALRAQPDFLPAAVALGDAHLAAGDAGQAVRAWERAAESVPALPLLARLAERYREEGRPRRMVALYERAAALAPDSLAVAVALGRVYFELSMLDEAAEQFEKIEVRAPDLPAIHAYLGAIFERRGQSREACEEYRRALLGTAGFEWPHRCRACGVTRAGWADRCPSCRRWNTLQP